MRDVSRRHFLATGAALYASRAIGANDRIHIAVIGCGNRGHGHLAEFPKRHPDVRITAVCDVDQASREIAQAFVESLTGEKPKAYDDLRKVFADKDVDAVIVAAPNHWHVLATVWACEAGKDVYVEKPASHSLGEGALMVETVRRTGRVVQVGSQSRSIPHKVKAIHLLHDGIIGPVYMARGLCYKQRPSIGHQPDSPVPPGVDWGLFLGPAPDHPFNALRFKYNFHWFWDTGNGDIGDQGIHELDIARWGLGDVTWPKSVSGVGGKFVHDDDQQTPNTLISTFHYGDQQIVFEVRNLLTGHEEGLPTEPPRAAANPPTAPDRYLPPGPRIPSSLENTIGNLFYGSQGWMALDDAGFRVYKGAKNDILLDERAANGTNSTLTGPDTVPHMRNFLDTVRSRNLKNLHADVSVGVMSANLCHLANASFRVGRSLTLEPSGAVANDEQANKLLDSSFRPPYAP